MATRKLVKHNFKCYFANMTSGFDVNGCYTGVVLDNPNEMPDQDADDL